MEPISRRPLTQPSSHFLISRQERLQLQAPTVTLDDSLSAFFANLCQHQFQSAQMDPPQRPCW